MPVLPINDASDPRLDDYRDIRDRDLLGPNGRGGLFIAEGALCVEKLIALPGRTKSLLLAPSWQARFEANVPDDVPVYVVPLSIVEAVAGFPVHRGVLAMGFRPAPAELSLDAVVPSDTDQLTVLLAEDINNIDNIGMLFRNAAAFGVDAVVLNSGCHDPLYRKSIRVSVGHVLGTPWARSEQFIDDLQRLRSEWGLTIIGTTIDPAAPTIDEIEPPRRVGIVVGAEYAGVTGAALDACDLQARIPMAPGVDSLNVGVAAAICLHRFGPGYS